MFSQTPQSQSQDDLSEVKFHLDSPIKEEKPVSLGLFKPAPKYSDYKTIVEQGFSRIQLTPLLQQNVRGALVLDWHGVMVGEDETRFLNMKTMIETLKKAQENGFMLVVSAANYLMYSDGKIERLNKLLPNLFSFLYMCGYEATVHNPAHMLNDLEKLTGLSKTQIHYIDDLDDKCKLAKKAKFSVTKADKDGRYLASLNKIISAPKENSARLKK